MQWSRRPSSPPALMAFWLRKVSSTMAVLPVWRSPTMSSRCPRPMGISESIALRPVCIGSKTLRRGMMPGALTSTCRSSSESIGPLPSIGLPTPSTTRPSRPRPTGTETMRPVRLTRSPSRTPRSSPKSTTPTLSDSRLSAIPRTPPGSSTSSPAWTLSRPQTRATPSPTESTVPTSAISARSSKRSSCSRRTEEISAARGSIGIGAPPRSRRGGRRSWRRPRPASPGAPPARAAGVGRTPRARPAEG